jgi:hypothetical protein
MIYDRACPSYGCIYGWVDVEYHMLITVESLLHVPLHYFDLYVITTLSTFQYYKKKIIVLGISPPSAVEVTLRNRSIIQYCTCTVRSFVTVFQNLRKSFSESSAKA